MKSWYEQKEEDICNLLCPKDAEGKKMNLNYQAIPSPDNEAEFKKTYTVSTVFVYCGSADYGEDQTTSSTIQEETVLFELEIRASSRRGDKGILRIVDDVRRKLMGYKFPGCKKMTISKFGFVDGPIQNNWTYFMQFSIRRTVVESLPEPDYPLAKNIEFQN